MIPSGYKQTEIGVIPEDWEVRDFGKVGSYYKGGGISMREVCPAGLPCIMYGDIYVKYDTSFKECDYRIDYETAKNSVKASPQDLFFTASGETADDIGRCVSYQGEDDIYIGGDIIALHPSNEYDSLFLAYVQNSEKVKKQKASFAQGHSVVHISTDNIKKTLFASPKYPEQKRIAEALSDMDELIGSLEKLIKKKKALKQGVMQELLTGKRRLPGFSGEWVENSFSDLFDHVSSRDHQIQTTEYLDYGLFPVIDQGKEKVVAYSDDYTKIINPPRDGAIVFGDHTRIVKHINGSFIIGADGVQVLTSKQNHSTVFLYYLLENLEIPDTGYNRHFKFIKETKFFVPQDLDEELKIASVISDIELSICSLEDYHIKYCKLKSGMMSELLTGRIRLV